MSNEEVEKYHPIYMYKAKWFTTRKVDHLMYALERSHYKQESNKHPLEWSWHRNRRTYLISGKDALQIVTRLNEVYPGEVIEV